MKVIIEIPKGDNRRRHIKPDKSAFIDLGPIKEVIPVNGGVMPVHYGYIPGTRNEKEGDEIDALVLSSEDYFKVGQEVEVKSIALIRRSDGDDKVIAVDESMSFLTGWDDIPAREREIIEAFFSYHHAFLAIEDAEAANTYVEEGRRCIFV